ncbi:glycosyltransferase family 4 protein [Tianweitania sp. BSSL-BM11]|uniref:Glycosyltransferase family 4 protein n=1 Tax=Tianweitania aestuarii TaxID=2814886 RepID=A0ABS5RWC4_9HYPH|nr:glycosyltransferase family 1 protein [Tianweitania aestuarii]MBS9721297.1 glycosyltransferase family 4 protein [Tianweitania aestuarii]
MKVILSVEPIRYPLTGIGRYTLELARNLSQLKDVEELRYFSDAAFVDTLPDGMEAASATAPASRMLRLKREVAARFPFLLNIYRRRVDTARTDTLAGKGDYVYHGPNFYLPKTDGPAVVTMHDLSVLKMPQFHPPERVAFMTREVEVAMERATAIITVSDFIRHEIAAHFGLPLERIFTTSLAGSADFFARDQAITAPILATMGLKPGGYALYAGTIEPRKNLERLLAAYEALPTTLRTRFPLVLAGYKGWNNAGIHARIRQATAEGWARYLGYVPEEALPHLFAGARLFAFPSLYEGFGLPVLEAMASGVPVVCSNAASLPEVAGNAALMVQAEDVEGLTAALERGLTDEAWRDGAIAAGFSQAARFSWARCARETADVYRHVLGQRA